jgi:hypothetical protein
MATTEWDGDSVSSEIDLMRRRYGGERGIRILDASMGSASCRLLVAVAAINVRNAVPRCPPLLTAVIGLTSGHGLYGIPECWRAKPPRGGVRDAVGEDHAP